MKGRRIVEDKIGCDKMSENTFKVGRHACTHITSAFYEDKAHELLKG